MAVPALSTTRACKHMLRAHLAPHRGHPIAPVPPVLVWGAWRGWSLPCSCWLGGGGKDDDDDGGLGGMVLALVGWRPSMGSPGTAMGRSLAWVGCWGFGWRRLHGLSIRDGRRRTLLLLGSKLLVKTVWGCGNGQRTPVGFPGGHTTSPWKEHLSRLGDTS